MSQTRVFTWIILFIVCTCISNSLISLLIKKRDKINTIIQLFSNLGQSIATVLIIGMNKLIKHLRITLIFDRRTLVCFLTQRDFIKNGNPMYKHQLDQTYSLLLLFFSFNGTFFLVPSSFINRFSINIPFYSLHQHMLLPWHSLSILLNTQLSLIHHSRITQLNIFYFI